MHCDDGGSHIMRKFLLASMLLLGVASAASQAFASADDPIDTDRYQRGAYAPMTKYADVLRTSGFGDTIYIGYTPLSSTAKNPWSIRASTTTAGTTNVHRPPAPGC